ncbi:MAG: hypothetical protein AAFY82_02595 [Pseudomonadota bacterium]
MMRRWFQSLFALAGLLTFAACSEQTPFRPVSGADMTVVATEIDANTWRVDFHLPSPQRSVFFSRSNGDYRRSTWTPIGTAPDLERVDGFDALFFDEATDTFSYEFAPRTDYIQGDYTPFLEFSDGGKAVYLGQFELLSIASRADLEALAGELRNWQGVQWSFGVRIKSDRPLMVQGARFEGELDQIATGGGTYVYVGDGAVIEGGSFIGVVDNELPAHILKTFNQDIADVFAAYEARWGFALPSKATIYYAFGGYNAPGTSHAGSVIGKDLVVLQSEGAGLREPNPDDRTRALWFFAHEGAHMFQNTVRQNQTRGEDTWIHEGSANSMANSVIRALPGMGDGFVMQEYRTAFEQCLEALAVGSLVTAHMDGRFAAHYSCGQIFNAAADAALPDHDLFGFWKAYSAQLEDDTPSPAETYFETLEALGADPAVPALIRELAYQDQSDPRPHLIELMSVSGLAPAFDEAGVLVALRVPD